MEDPTPRQTFTSTTVIMFVVAVAMSLRAALPEEGLFGLTLEYPWWSYILAFLASAAVGGLVAGCYHVNQLKERARSAKEGE